MQQLRSCQVACLKAIDNGARIIEMACGTGKTRIMQELAIRQKPGKVLVIVPTLVLLSQFAETFPTFSLLGTGHNQQINWNAQGFLAVSDSVHFLS